MGKWRKQSRAVIQPRRAKNGRSRWDVHPVSQPGQARMGTTAQHAYRHGHGRNLTLRPDRAGRHLVGQPIHEPQAILIFHAAREQFEVGHFRQVSAPDGRFSLFYGQYRQFSGLNQWLYATKTSISFSQAMGKRRKQSRAVIQPRRAKNGRSRWDVHPVSQPGQARMGTTAQHAYRHGHGRNLTIRPDRAGRHLVGQPIHEPQAILISPSHRPGWGTCHPNAYPAAVDTSTITRWSRYSITNTTTCHIYTVCGPYGPHTPLSAYLRVIFLAPHTRLLCMGLGSATGISIFPARRRD